MVLRVHRLVTEPYKERCGAGRGKGSYCMEKDAASAWDIRPQQRGEEKDETCPEGNLPSGTEKLRM